MSQQEQTKKIPGVSREEETKMLSDILAIADENLNRTKSFVQNMADELHELKEIYDVEDKEGLALWFNADARFQQVRQELLRMERTRKKPYFGRIDFSSTNAYQQECYYIGKSAISKEAADLIVIDWRAPIASVYYEKTIGVCTYSVKGEGAFEIELFRKRTYEIENDELKDYFDSDVVANDDLLTKYLARNKRAVLNEIIATIQQEQNEIIRKKPQHNVIVQGGAGSGKTTVAMHRISYILYNYDLEFKPKDFYIIGSNRILLNYITGILPDLDVYGASQMTMEQLFTRLLYEDWDKQKFTVKSLDKRDKTACLKGSFSWFHDLEAFCQRYEWNYINREDVYTEKTHHLLMKQSLIEKLLTEFHYLSLPDKLDKLTEHLMAKLENEIYGRDYTYPPEEKKALIRYYQTYFGKREWKGSIFELYDQFLEEQNKKRKINLQAGTELDLYDLAALAYLYKRIKETEIIQEASHVVIDEAQDFGMMVYGALNYCLSKCTYTIMGDVSQNIYFEYGLTDWEELRSLMLPGAFDYFGILKKSYRNTVEISNFAIHILQHGNFPIYPVEPIIRHGEEVRITECKKEEELIVEAVRTILQWQKKNYETIAVICREEEEAAKVAEQLGKKIELRDFHSDTEEFGRGVMVLPIEYAKGLEFDVVLLFNADDVNYPAEDGFAKLLYVAATRALHEMVVLYTGKLTDLIGAPVSEEKKMKYLVEQSKQVIKTMPKEEDKTRTELELELAQDGKQEMELRNRIGPKRIEVQKNNTAKTEERKPDIRKKELSTIATPTKKVMAKKATVFSTEKNEFGKMPETTSLRPLGHSQMNLSIRWVTGDKTHIELSNAYGVLRVTPVSEDTVGIQFTREKLLYNMELPEELMTTSKPGWKYKDGKDTVELMTAKLLLRMDKKTGTITFYTAKGKLLLAEDARFPRQIENAPLDQTWTYFNWSSKEILKARGTADSEWLDLSGRARYISHGNKGKRPACLMSNNGYQILIPAGKTAMCCAIPAYGTYIHTEGETQIEYFFRTAL